MYHSPVMPLESIHSLDILSDGVYVDLTFGGGGHSKLILDNLSRSGKLIAFDQDIDAINNKIDDSRLILINQNFKFLEQNLTIHMSVLKCLYRFRLDHSGSLDWILE